jgi:DNA sulfur modification protein DndD
MILDSIVLRDFGVYGGRQEVVLGPLNKTKPIVLFGGLNGGGKTTLLDAVQLALYGSRARCSGRGRLGYREYLREMIHRGAAPQTGAAVELSFRRLQNAELQDYRVVRSWHENTKGIEESVQVFRGQEFDPQLSEQWDEFIESFIPSGIAHLFFFDAEQIKELAAGEHSAEILGTAIHTLLGLNLVDRLETDLVVLERRKRIELKPGPEAERMKHAQAERDRIQQLLDEAKAEGAALGTRVGRLAKELASCEQKFRQEGGDLYLNRVVMEEERSGLVAKVSKIETELRELAAGTAPLLLVTQLLSATEKQARKESEVQTSRVLVAALQDRDEATLGQLKRSKIAERHLEQLRAILKKDRDNRQRGLRTPCFLHADPHLAAELRHLRSGILPGVQASIEQRLANVTTLTEQITRLEQKLARVPAQDAISGLLKDQDRLRKELQEQQAELAANDAKVQVLNRQLLAAEESLKRAFGSDVDVQMGTEQGARILKHSAKVRDSLAQFRVALIRRHAEQIERLVLESFTHLLRKSNLVTKIRIDPTTFAIELTGGDGKPLPMDRLSAGERQLLATALLWGLAKASGRPLPTMIDTPLGRLDSSHRRHMLERYFPVASHQVILLSTDEEVDEAGLDRLKPHVGLSYHLSFDEGTRSTKIMKGYFWKHETTT